MRDKLLEVNNIANKDNGHMFCHMNITADDIKWRIKKLQTNKAQIFDEIVPKLLIENVDCLSEPLEYIYIYTITGQRL